MGSTLKRRLHEAEKDQERLVKEHAGLTKNLSPELTEQWEKMCVKWELALFPKSNVFNPFKVKEEFLGEEQALAELAEEEKERVRAGGVQYHSVDAAGFVKLGLSLSDDQYASSSLVQSLHSYNPRDKLRQTIQEHKREPTVRQARQINDQRCALRNRVKTFDEVRSIYMPGLSHYLSRTQENEDPSDVDPENIKIWLPSEVPVNEQSKICVPGLAQVEKKLQKARCHDSLKGVRHVLRVKTRMTRFKNSNVRGQRESGKAREIIDKVVSRLVRFADRYRKARLAYMGLEGSGAWEKTLRVLKDEDLRSYRDPATVRMGPGRAGTREQEIQEEDEEYWEELMSVRRKEDVKSKEAEGIKRSRVMTPEPEDGEEAMSLIHPDRTEWEHRSKHGTGETRKGLSWIWTAGGQLQLEDGADENDNEILRSEWCKSRARAKRATEEVELLKEEMRRTAAYLEWKAEQWEMNAAVAFEGERSSEREGRRAYALSQAALQRALREKFLALWNKPLVRGGDDLEDEHEEDEEPNDQVLDDEYSGEELDDDGEVEDGGEEGRNNA
ncbi:hypothetical protein VNI00_019079 [Paramarasmius palmivorus]|uniref:Uncharacterized protein n=1 Tax=Paramarasmius palmivorus TaxID=297713 RepID=A0AAW0AQC1_9AGAR